MIRRHAIIRLAVTAAAGISIAACGTPDGNHVQERAVVRDQDRVPSWRTTTLVENATLRRHQSATATGSLPAQPRAPKLPPSPLVANHQLDGIASYYWQEQKTATGEQFDKMAMTAAHKTLPFGTRVRVTNVSNRRSVVVRINDRGPFKPGRVIDLSYAAAGALGMHDKGLAPVRVEVVK